MSHFDNILGKQLAQANATTIATAIYTPKSYFITEITNIKIVNTDTVTREIYIYHDEDGTTYTVATIIYENSAVASKGAIELPESIWINGADSGNIAIKSDANNVVNVTLYGKEYKVG